MADGRSKVSDLMRKRLQNSTLEQVWGYMDRRGYRTSPNRIGRSSYVFLKDSKNLLVSRTLKEMEELLKDHPFLGVHHSHLINLIEIVHYEWG